MAAILKSTGISGSETRINGGNMSQSEIPEHRKYNGWANYETWNVALWISNDEGLYHIARSHRNDRHPYEGFVSEMREYGHTETPDGVAYNDSGLDIDALDEMIEGD